MRFQDDAFALSTVRPAMLMLDDQLFPSIGLDNA
jgi:hypothetical protein